MFPFPKCFLNTHNEEKLCSYSKVYTGVILLKLPRLLYSIVFYDNLAHIVFQSDFNI